MDGNYDEVMGVLRTTTGYYLKSTYPWRDWCIALCVQLLYLVPCCLGGVLIIAATQGDLGRVINFTDVAPTVSLLPKANDEGDKDWWLP